MHSCFVYDFVCSSQCCSLSQAEPRASGLQQSCVLFASLMAHPRRNVGTLALIRVMCVNAAHSHHVTDMLFAEANEFKAEYEKAMTHNEPLLDKDAPVASPEVGKEKDPEVEKKVDDLADKVAETKVAAEDGSAKEP